MNQFITSCETDPEEGGRRLHQSEFTSTFYLPSKLEFFPCEELFLVVSPVLFLFLHLLPQW